MSEPMTELLATIPIFARFSHQQLDNISRLMVKRRYPANHLLFEEGSPGDTFYVIISGEVEIQKKSAEGGDKVTLAVRGAGDFFGEMALIQNAPRFASAKIAQECQMLELPKQRFLSLLGSNPVLANQIMGALSYRLRESDLHLIEDLKKKNRELREAYDLQMKLASDLKQSNQQLQEAKEFLERIISTTPNAIVVTDPEKRIVTFNQTAIRFFGYSLEEIKGIDFISLFATSAQSSLQESIDQAIKESLLVRKEVTAQRRDGTYFLTQLTATGVQDERGEVVGVLGIIEDITEEKNLERQALELEQMASRGEMAAEVAHELNNYISILGGNLELLPYVMARGDYLQIQEKIKAMQEAIQKMTIFTENLMSLSQQKVNFVPCNLSLFLDNELAFIKPQARFRQVDFGTSWDPNLPTIQADPNRLQQLFYNLFNNAAAALSEVESRKREISVSTRFLPQREMVEIKVADTGRGIKAEHLDSVFEKRFTTKPKGHGFGLLTIKRVVEVHGGEISVDSKEGVGTTFTVLLPVKPPVETSKPKEFTSPEKVRTS
ncbi:MAG: PAS domain S-box protein [Candidatus Zixiibacteriota bacterium]|nr:MAG: PAS domain S-box protein [candidate division Zixibacteria bacterium]